mmetsp:Transcript_40959/g.109560  ORF Transcript_40959/g.109560 Transcript_40959/m.109560 type:complete len:97 (-) Transcript_40959:25-315(-)
MPMHKNPFVKGKLFVKFDVEFPGDGTISPDSRSLLIKALPPAQPVAPHPDSEEFVLRDADLTHMGRGGAARGGSFHDEDDEEEEGQGGQLVQCAQQ